jgi:hypothetical protein
MFEQIVAYVATAHIVPVVQLQLAPVASLKIWQAARELYEAPEKSVHPITGAVHVVSVSVYEQKLVVPVLYIF